MRYPASEKLEIIRLVERSHLPAKQTLDMLGVPRTTFYRWYERYRLEGQQALEDKAPLPARVWNRIPDEVRERLITLALDQPELSPRQHSSGGKNRLLGISKRGDVYLRALLIHGARAVVSQAKHKDDRLSRWVTNLATRRHPNVAAVALANKTARMAWAMLRHETDYDPDFAIR